MGLDIIEFVLGLEEAFGLRIPDAVAVNITTPRILIDYLHGQLAPSSESRCLSQRAFYRIRQGLVNRVGLPRASLRPDSELLALLPVSDAQEVWAGIGESLGYTRWPRARGNGWLASVFLSSRPRTLGEAAKQVAAVSPTSLKPAGEGWSWGEVAAVIDWHLRQNLGIQEYSLDDRFVEDLGLD
jgi:hypothetical protein